MEWSEQEKRTLEELRKMPDFKPTAEQRHRMYEGAVRRMQAGRIKRRWRVALTSVSAAAVAVVLAVGLFQGGGPLERMLNGGGDSPAPTGVFRSGAGVQAETMSAVFKVSPLEERLVTEEGMESTLRILETRLDQMAVEKVTLQLQSRDEILVHIEEKVNREAVVDALSKQMVLEFKSSSGEVLLTGEDLQSKAVPTTDPNTGIHQLAVEFKDPEKFEIITQKLLGQTLEIWLDGELQQQPVIQAVIRDGRAVISQPSREEAVILATNISAGTKPLPYKLVEVQE